MCDAICSHKTTGGLVCPPCKVHGELVGGLSCTAANLLLAKDAVDVEVCSKVCQLELVPN